MHAHAHTHMHTHTTLRKHHGKGPEIRGGMQDREGCHEVLSSGQEMAFACMNSQLLWLPGTDLHKAEHANISAWKRRWAPLALSLAELLLTVNGCWGQERPLSFSIVTG